MTNGSQLNKKKKIKKQRNTGLRKLMAGINYVMPQVYCV